METYDVIVLVGRILFAFLFIMSGIGHLTQTSAMAGYAQSRKLPQARIAVVISGIGLVIGGLLVLLGVWGDLGAIGLAVLMVVTAVLMHAFWRETDAGARANEMTAFNKDIALAGGALAFFAIYKYGGDALGATITGPLFG